MRALRWLFRLATLGLVAASVAAFVPYLAPAEPAQAQGVGQFGGGGFGQFGGSCGSFGQFGGQIGGGFGQFGGCSFGTGFAGGFGQIGGFGQFGGFVVSSRQSNVTAGATVPVLFGWVVPSPDDWRDLRSLDVRIRNRNTVALWVRWEESSNTFVAVDPKTGKPKGPKRAPGSNAQLGTSMATALLAGSAVEDSGAGGDNVAALLPVRFSAAAAGKTWLVDSLAEHDDGTLFVGPAGKFVVAR